VCTSYSTIFVLYSSSGTALKSDYRAKLLKVRRRALEQDSSSCRLIFTTTAAGSSSRNKFYEIPKPNPEII